MEGSDFVIGLWNDRLEGENMKQKIGIIKNRRGTANQIIHVERDNKTLAMQESIATSGSVPF